MASGEAWTVAYYGGDGGGRALEPTRNRAILTIVDHWDGSSWTQQDSPNTPYESGFLGVYALTPNDVWAVGDQFTGFTALTEHWDGTSWSIVSTPATQGAMLAVSAVSSDDVWAAGDRYVSGGHAPYLLHWDGSAWSQISI